MKLSDFVASFLAQQKIKNIFLLPGGGNMHLVDSVGKNKDLEYVACLHEQAAAIAADGYAQYRGDLGAAIVTTGPGGTNAITGVAGAWVESVPVLIISGQVKTADIKPFPEMRMLGFQEIDIVSMVKPITKYAVTVLDSKSILYHLSKAVYYSKAGRPGPVWIDIPLDVQAAEIQTDELLSFDPSELSRSLENNKSDIEYFVSESVKLLTQATRPVIIAGNGIKISKSQTLFLELVEKLGIPVLTTWKGCDLLTDENPLFYGRPGTVGQRCANFIQQNSDLVLSLGCRLDFGQIGYAQEAFAREAKKIIVDIDPNEFIKFRFKVDIKATCDVSEYIHLLIDKIQDRQLPDWADWHNQCKIWKEKFPVPSEENLTCNEYVSTYALVNEISGLAQSTDIIIPCSSGSAADITSQTIKLKTGQRVINSPGLGSMGFGIPQSIGACVAGNRNRTICINGDGGFQLNIQELETIKRLNLPIKFFYLNNQGYISIRTTQNNYFEGRFVATNSNSGLTLPDIRRISEAYGIKCNQIKNNAELKKGIMEALSSEGPFICEVLSDPFEQVAPKVKSIINAKGQMISKPLEDMAPFLERKEFIENMIITPVNE